MSAGIIFFQLCCCSTLVAGFQWNDAPDESLLSAIPYFPCPCSQTEARRRRVAFSEATTCNQTSCNCEVYQTACADLQCKCSANCKSMSCEPLTPMLLMEATDVRLSTTQEALLLLLCVCALPICYVCFFCCFLCSGIAVFPFSKSPTVPPAQPELPPMASPSPARVFVPGPPVSSAGPISFEQGQEQQMVDSRSHTSVELAQVSRGDSSSLGRHMNTMERAKSGIEDGEIDEEADAEDLRGDKAGVALQVGLRVKVHGKFEGHICFLGVTSFAAGIWCGLELETDNGKNDGSIKGIRYFSCAPTRGLFVRPSAAVVIAESDVSNVASESVSGNAILPSLSVVQFEARVTQADTTVVDFHTGNESGDGVFPFVRVQLLKDAAPLMYEEVVTLLASRTDDGESLRSLVVQVLGGDGGVIPFAAYFWECTPVSEEDLGSTIFEFVAIDAPDMGLKDTDSDAFLDKLSPHEFTLDAVDFMTPSPAPKETNLIAPARASETELSVYRSIGSFFKGAQAEQADNLLQKLGSQIPTRLSARGDPSMPLWVSTAGYDVAWLHVRLDDSPKYYRFKEYKGWRDTEQST